MEELILKNAAKPSGPVKLKNGWTVEVDRELCIGAATCAALAPLSYALDEEAKAVIPQTIDEDELETILAGAKSCPVDAIVIRDQNGKKIYPR